MVCAGVACALVALVAQLVVRIAVDVVVGSEPADAQVTLRLLKKWRGEKIFVAI